MLISLLRRVTVKRRRKSRVQHTYTGDDIARLCFTRNVIIDIVANVCRVSYHLVNLTGETSSAIDRLFYRRAYHMCSIIKYRIWCAIHHLPLVDKFVVATRANRKTRIFQRCLVQAALVYYIKFFLS